jgi:hypothetical protein
MTCVSSPILLGVPSTFLRFWGCSSGCVGILKSVTTVGDIKLSVAPLSMRALISEVRDADLRFTGARMERFQETNAAWGKRALSMAVYFEPSKNLSPLRSSSRSTALVDPLKVVQCARLSLGLRHLC